MTLSELLKKTLAAFAEHNVSFALAGGMVASIYRNEPRATGDLEFLILAKTSEHSLSVGKHILQSLEFQIGLARQADLEGGPLFAIKKKKSHTP